MAHRKDRVCPVERARHLDSGFRRLFQNPRRILHPYVREGMTVLDFGCGPGFWTLDLAEMVGASGRVIAADLQEGMLEKLRAKIRGTELEARITLHPCPKDRIGLATRVDFVLAIYVLHELPDQRAFFEEIRTMLAPEGAMLVVEPPIHVSRRAFETTLERAREAGLVLPRRPRVPFNKAALLRKAPTVPA